MLPGGWWGRQKANNNPRCRSVRHQSGREGVGLGAAGGRCTPWCGEQVRAMEADCGEDRLIGLGVGEGWRPTRAETQEPEAISRSATMRAGLIWIYPNWSFAYNSRKNDTLSRRTGVEVSLHAKLAPGFHRWCCWCSQSRLANPLHGYWGAMIWNKIYIFFNN